MHLRSSKQPARWSRAVIELLLLAGWATIAAQNLPPGEPASISGVVTNSVTGEPILRAHVLLQSMGERSGIMTSRAGVRIQDNDADTESQSYGALTDGEGKFTIARLPAGKYFVSVERVGFVAPVDLPSDSNTISLSASDKKENFKVKLIPAGVIAGRIFDADGEPVPNAEVRAEGARDTKSTGTDEQGRYRIGGLHPGKYRLRAGPPRQLFGTEIRTGSQEIHLAATYYPDSLARASARAIDVPAAAQLSGIDIRLVRTPSILVSGKVSGLTTGNQRAEIQASRPGESDFGAPSHTVHTDGTFTMSSLDPGKYTLVAIVYGSGQHFLRSAPQEIDVAGTNIEHIELQMIPPFEVTGHVRFDDEQARMPKARPRPAGLPDSFPMPPITRRINLQPAEFPGSSGGSAEIGPDDSFTVEKVSPGRYRVSLSWGPGYVQSVRIGLTETEGDTVDVSHGAAGPITISVGSRSCELSGTVTDGNGPVANASVVLVPDGGSRQYTGRARSKSDGTYTISGVPPGKYKIAVTDDSFYPNTMRGDALEDYADVAESIELHPGEKVTKNLRRK